MIHQQILKNILAAVAGLEAKPGEGVQERVPGGRALAHGAQPGTGCKRDMGPSCCGPTTCRRHHKGFGAMCARVKALVDSSPATKASDWDMECLLSDGC